ncbi:MAG: hypothetical protein ACI8P9_003133 [Parasphingorhabdus sp.]
MHSWPGPSPLPPASQVASLRQKFGLGIPNPMALETAPFRPNLEHPAAAQISFPEIGVGVRTRSERAKNTWPSPGRPRAIATVSFGFERLGECSGLDRVRAQFGGKYSANPSSRIKYITGHLNALREPLTLWLLVPSDNGAYVPDPVWKLKIPVSVPNANK